MVVVSSLCISLEKQSACERAGGDTFNPVYRANSKSLSEELRRLTSCSYPPNMYIALARTQAEWPSLAPGTVPEILGMNHLWVSVKMQHLTFSTVVMDASSHLTVIVARKGFWTPHAFVMYRYSTGLRIRLESPSAVLMSTVTNTYPHPACAPFWDVSLAHKFRAQECKHLVKPQEFCWLILSSS